MFFKHLKLVTFDVTNTLLKFKEPPWQAYGELARKYGFTGENEALSTRFLDKYKHMLIEHPNFGKNSNLSWEDWWREIVRYTFKDQIPVSSNVDIIATQLINKYRYKDSWTCVEGGVKLLDMLRERRITIGVISNFDPRLHEILHSIKLEKYFNFVLTSYEVGYCKPDKRIFEFAIKKCGHDVEPNMCLHIGDDIVKDFQGAKSAGWHAMLVTNEEGPSVQKHSVSSLQELMLAIQKNSVTLTV